MKQIIFKILINLTVIGSALKRTNIYMMFLTKAHKLMGVKFKGKPRYIHKDAHLDPVGSLELGDGIVISTNVIILTHDYSYTVGLKAINEGPKTDIAFHVPVTIGDNCFIGAKTTILPGTTIGKDTIIGAGSVVKGTFPDDSVIAGNPAKVIAKTSEWIKKKKETFPKEMLHIDPR